MSALWLQLSTLRPDTVGGSTLTCDSRFYSERAQFLKTAMSSQPTAEGVHVKLKRWAFLDEKTLLHDLIR